MRGHLIPVLVCVLAVPLFQHCLYRALSSPEGLIYDIACDVILQLCADKCGTFARLHM